jgi:hypothetical protein
MTEAVVSFKVKVSNWRYAAFLAEGFLSLACTSGLLYLFVYSIEQRDKVAWGILIWAAFFLFWLGDSVKRLVQLVLYNKRVSVQLGAEGMVITDWRSRSITITWTDIQEVRAVDWNNMPTLRIFIWRTNLPLLYIKAGGRITRISQFVENPQVLLDEITSRAGLVEGLVARGMKWYARPEK